METEMRLFKAGEVGYDVVEFFKPGEQVPGFGDLVTRFALDWAMDYTPTANGQLVTTLYHN